ncbi:MAG: methyltransferase domain-containing protein [Planctomycetaceae bacterium]
MRLASTLKHAVARLARRSSTLSALKQHYDSRRRTIEFRCSQQYWEERYEKGGDSGEGSYGKLARYKAKFINAFSSQENCRSVIEFGCGDGNQASLLSVGSYTGIDISERCIAACRKMLGHRGYQFQTLQEYHANSAAGLYDLSLSLDVIYHLIEDDVYRAYVTTLLHSSCRYSLIYASNFELYDQKLPHVRHRSFVDDIRNWYPEWEFVSAFENPYLKPHDSREYGSFAQFHLFRRR